jgi:hypothetical protein
MLAVSGNFCLPLPHLTSVTVGYLKMQSISFVNQGPAISMFLLKWYADSLETLSNASELTLILLETIPHSVYPSRANPRQRSLPLSNP